jgi:lipopolysaccharide export system permease protein
VRILDQYIGSSFAKGFLLVILLLASIFSFLDLVEELEDVGKGYYRISDALFFVALTVPGRIVSLAPVAALLGCILGLGILDQCNEFVAMRAAGVSPRRIGWSAMKTGFLLMLVVAAGIQFAVPELAQRAWKNRVTAISGTLSLRTDEETGFWFRDGLRFISIQDMVYGRVPTDIDIFEFSDQGRLNVFTHAEEAHHLTNGKWMLLDVTQRIIGEQDVRLQTYPTLQWNAFLTPHRDTVMELEPENLSLTDLYSYTRDLRRRGQNAERYETALWQKLSIPLATGAMILIAIPFLFGGYRTVTTGQKVLLGAGVGIAFYLGGEIINQIGLALNLMPALPAIAPVVLLLAVALYLLRRVK